MSVDWLSGFTELEGWALVGVSVAMAITIPDNIVICIFYTIMMLASVYV